LDQLLQVNQIPPTTVSFEAAISISDRLMIFDCHGQHSDEVIANFLLT
jgi:hypothetical protein